MATTEIVVPTGPGSNGWIRELSVDLDAGNDTKFVDEDGNDSFVNVLNIKADGAITYLGFKQLEANPSNHVAIYLVKGHFTTVQSVHKIYASGTDASLGLHVKIQ